MFWFSLLMMFIWFELWMFSLFCLFCAYGLGKFKTIISLSLVYCLGSVLLSVTSIEGLVGYIPGTDQPNAWGVIISLFLIAVGTGGIKSCVSSFVGDQFTDPDQLAAVFAWFYFMINSGSLISTFLTPILKEIAYWIAFGIPAVLLILATVVFASGHSFYIIVCP